MRRTALITLFCLAGSAGMPAGLARGDEPTSLPASLPSGSSGPTSRNWELTGSGKWDPIKAASTQQAVVNPTLDRAETLLNRHEAKTAYDLLVAWVKDPMHQAAYDRDRALLLLADADYQRDDRVKAYYQLDELLDTYPESRFYNSALERQFSIAEEYLNGYKEKVLGIPLFGQEEKAIDMLYRVRERSPGSPLAERALIRTADHYFATSQFDFAGDAYAAFARSYPRSPELGRVRLRQALSSLAQFHGTRFDGTPLIDARTQFEDLKIRYPEIAEQADVQKFIETINRTLAKKLLGTADFYGRTSKLKAKAYTLQTLVLTYPRTPEADLARAELAKMPKAVVKEASKARAGTAYLPNSQPSALGPPAPPKGSLLPTTRPTSEPATSPNR